MNKIIGVLLFLFSCSLYAADDEVAGFSKVAGNSKIRIFGDQLCYKMAEANATGKDIVKTLEDQMLSYMKISRATPNYKDEIIKFWNANKNDFICHGKVDSTTRETEHLMKRAIALSIHNKVFDGFLFDTDEIEFDYNAIEMVDGKPETVLDYLDKVIADPKFSRNYVESDILRLRKDLIDYFDAKTAQELINEGKLESRK